LGGGFILFINHKDGESEEWGLSQFQWTEEIAVVLKTSGVSTGTWIRYALTSGLLAVWIGDYGNPAPKFTLPQVTAHFQFPF
jgi:hypothetical protein